MATKHDAVTVRSRAKTTPGLSNATGLKKVVKPNRQKKIEKKDKSRRTRNGGARPKNEKKKKLENREKFLKRVDPRNSATTRTASDRQVMSNVSPAHQFEVDLPAKNLAGIMVGVVSFALSRGWQTYSASDSVPFLAYVYGTNVLLQYATNSTPALTTVPRWLNIMGQMLTTKCVFTRTGKITYRFKPDNLTPEVSATWTEPMGPLTYNRLWNIGIAGNTVINMHFRDIVAPVAYTEELGKPAFASLAQFLAEKLDTESSMQEFVAVTLTDYYTGDCSAYAVNVHVPGSGFNGTGGLGTNLQLEIPIRTPIMSVLRAAPSMSGDHTRYPAFVKQSAGDPVFAGGMLCSIMPNSEVSTKKVPLFHCVDFLEFADTLALYCQQLVIQATSTPEFLTSAVANTDAINYACPLTLQEVMLCLRAQMMNAFKETAHAVQGLYPKIPANGDNNEFVAFVSGFGTCPYPGVTNMLLPLSFVENIRSLTARSITGYKNGKKHPLRAIPILGKFYNDVLNPSDYDVTYKVNEVEKTVHVFLTPETYVGDVKVSQKGKEKQKIPVAEEIIDLIDGKTGQSFVAINDPGALNPLISLWNSWIQRMSSFSQALAEIGTDAGISLLEMITCTSYFVELTPGDDKVKDPRMTTNNGFTANEYSKRKIIAYSFNQPPYQAPWERIQQRWIAPIIHVDFATTTENSTAFQRMSVLFQEPYQMNVAESSANWTLSNRHLQYAISMTKSQFTRVDEDEKFFADAEKYGRGGILSSLASAFSGPIANISGQLISAGINTAANMIPV